MTLSTELNMLLKRAIEKASWDSYYHGRLDALHNVKKALSVLDVPQVQIDKPITIKDILGLVDNWIEDATKDLERQANNG